MSDQSTRATEPQADPRQPFTLSKEDAIALHAAADPTGRSWDDTQAALNSWWLDAGQRLGFVWTTVADLTWQAGSDQAHVANPAGIISATFTAWPIVKAWEPDPDAVAWLSDMVTTGDAYSLKNRELILRAWADGRDTGFAMGSAAPSRPVGLGWDGMILIRESAELLRSYEAQHLAKVERLVASGARDPDTEAAVDDTRSKARRNAAQAERLESFLADPTQSHLVHDGLREARGDAALGVVVGWEAALIEVRNLVESGRANAGSAIPPLVLLSRLAELEAPEDMDEMLGPWRGVTEGIARIADMRGEKPSWMMASPGGGWSRADHLRWAGDAVRAWREFHDKSEWVREAVKIGVPKALGMPSQLGRHTMDTARDLVGRLNTLLAQAIAGTLAGLHVQATADVLQAMGIGKAGPVLEPEETVDGKFPGDPGYKDATSPRFPIAEGLECMGAPERPDFVAWCSAGFADGDIVEVREKDGHEHPMKVGSPQFVNALRELGERMPVRAATAEQRKGWESTDGA